MFGVCVGFTIVCTVWLLVGLLPLGLYGFFDTKAGTFGDAFGFVNALFSGLAFAGIIVAILLQRQELALQRQELKLTREQLERAADAQTRSEKALSRQATSLLLAAYLNSVDGMRQSYAILSRSGDVFDVDEEAFILKQQDLLVIQNELFAQIQPLVKAALPSVDLGALLPGVMPDIKTALRSVLERIEVRLIKIFNINVDASGHAVEEIVDAFKWAKPKVDSILAHDDWHRRYNLLTLERARKEMDEVLKFQEPEYVASHAPDWAELRKRAETALNTFNTAIAFMRE